MPPPTLVNKLVPPLHNNSPNLLLLEGTIGTEVQQRRTKMTKILK